ncbi:MAG: hypothetical protein QOF76_2150, partial [Solirubrobacteraceae bacterium]|nr:hypothetical protein [Solirubrobacteraceae bacterium]
VQGLGGAMSSAVILGMLVTMFPEPREQAKAMGVYGFVASAGGSIGLLLGGVLTDAISWHWIFLINVPVGIVTALLTLRVIEDRDGLGFSHGADLPGAALLTVGLMLGVYTILQAGEHGWGTSASALLGGSAMALLLAFIVRQSRIATPLLPLRLFRSAHVAGANLVQGLVVVGMFGVFFLSALYLSKVQGYSPLQVGLTFLPSSIVMGVISLRLFEPVSTRFGARRTMLGGLVSILAGLLLFARLPVHASFWLDISPAMMLFGGGAGFVFPALMTFAMSGASPEDAGVASGLVNTSMQVGGALGLAVLATLSTDHTRALAAGGASHAGALTGGYQLAFGVGAGLVAVALVIAFAVLRPAHERAERRDLVAA